MELRQHFSANMSQLYQNILRMGTMVEEALKKSLVAISNHDMELARQVIDEDIRIDEMQARIEDQCALLIATESPVASDLREIITAVKIVSNIERIGDHARHIARAVDKLKSPALLATVPKFRKLAELGIGMIHDAVTAFVEQDADRAREVADRDDLIDDLHAELYREIVAIMTHDGTLVEEGITMTLLARFMERLGDHVTNICEWIVFAKQGKHIELNS
ncbi:MAG TPA: phosphate signaling complex protein PhoU [Spirochaetia bacterium]|nr:phosphate signaling complex protein PhoU [Spirochaetia bacterium]